MSAAVASLGTNATGGFDVPGWVAACASVASAPADVSAFGPMRAVGRAPVFAKASPN